MASLSFCGGDLILLVEGGGLSAGLTFAFSRIDRISSSGGVQKMNSPSPSGTMVTDHVVRMDDKVSVSGLLGCRRCSQSTPVLQLINPALKRATSTIVYNNDYFALTSKTFIATNMIITNYSIDESQSTLQEISISIDFEAANIAGDISAPSFQAGGFIGF